MSENRPKPDSTCEGVDSLKFGVSDNLPAYAGDATRDTLMQTLASRNVHILLGANVSALSFCLHS